MAEGARPASPPVRHVLWDWNGTLLDDVESCVLALNTMLSRRGLATVSSADYRRSFGFPVRRYYLELGFDLSTESWAGVAREYHDSYARFSPAAPLRAGAREALSLLRRDGIGMSILSAAPRDLLSRMVAERGIAGHFHRLAGLGDLYAESKLEAGKALLLEMGVPSDHVILVGDTTHDVEVARALGCRCVLVEGGHQSSERLRGLAPLAGSIEGVLEHLRAGR